MQRWAFADTTQSSTYRRQWASLHAWHTAYSTADSIALGMLHDVDATDSLKIGGCPAMSWSASWKLLDSRGSGHRHCRSQNAPVPVSSTSSTARESLPSTSSSAPLRKELKGNALRQALSSAARASDLNVVAHPGQTDADMRRIRLHEDAGGYVQQNLN
eukprot:3629073-Pleurochrysis_carterae.AAC.1